MTETTTTWTGYYWMAPCHSFGWERAGGWYSCPATEGCATENEALEVASRFGSKVKAKCFQR
jgi:hypothetical protein